MLELKATLETELTLLCGETSRLMTQLDRLLKQANLAKKEILLDPHGTHLSNGTDVMAAAVQVHRRLTKATQLIYLICEVEPDTTEANSRGVVLSSSRAPGAPSR